MKLLFFTGYLDDKLNANSRIAYIIAENLAVAGFDVTVCGLSLTEDFSQIKSDNLKFLTFTSQDLISKAKRKLELYIKGGGGQRDVMVKKFAMRHPLASIIIAYSYSPFHKERKIAPNTKDFLEKLHNKEHFDMAFAFQMPIWTIEWLLLSSMPNCKKAIYQLDPYGLHKLNTKEETINKTQIEVNNFDKADLIFTTPILLKEYMSNDNYRKFKDKIVAVEFPTLYKIKKKATDDMPFKFDTTKINFAFCGIMEDVYRNPKIFLDLFASIVTENSNVIVYFVGDIMSNTVKQYAKNYPDNIKIYSRVDSETSLAILQNADFLLNIGNNLTNQMPSKIFEYFSLGKPIIHLKVVKNCSCESYIKKYPLSFIIENSDINTQEKFMKFITDNKNSFVDLEIVEDLFAAHKPDAVINEIISEIGKG